MISRTLISISLSLALLTGCANISRPPVTVAAAMDSVTTYVGLQHGAVELNPMGFAGTNLAKLYYLYHLRPGSSQLEQEDMDRTLSSLFLGAAVNNIIQLIWAPSLILSVSAGLYVGLSAYEQSNSAADSSIGR